MKRVLLTLLLWCTASVSLLWAQDGVERTFWNCSFGQGRSEVLHTLRNQGFKVEEMPESGGVAYSVAFDDTLSLLGTKPAIVIFQFTDAGIFYNVLSYLARTSEEMPARSVFSSTLRTLQEHFPLRAARGADRQAYHDGKTSLTLTLVPIRGVWYVALGITAEDLSDFHPFSSHP